MVSLLALLSLHFGSYFELDSDQIIHVQRAVNVGHVCERMVGAAQHAIDLSNIHAILCPNHDGIQGRRRAFEVNEQSTFVTS